MNTPDATTGRHADLSEQGTRRHDRAEAHARLHGQPTRTPRHTTQGA